MFNIIHNISFLLLQKGYAVFIQNK